MLSARVAHALNTSARLERSANGGISSELTASTATRGAAEPGRAAPDSIADSTADEVQRRDGNRPKPIRKRETITDMLLRLREPHVLKWWSPISSSPAPLSRALYSQVVK